MEDPRELFFARNWAWTVSLIGVLLVLAAADPTIRVPIVAVAAIGKAVFVGTLIQNFATFTRGYLSVIAIDSVCVVLYALYLLGF